MPSSGQGSFSFHSPSPCERLFSVVLTTTAEMKDVRGTHLGQGQRPSRPTKETGRVGSKEKRARRKKRASENEAGVLRDERFFFLA